MTSSFLIQPPLPAGHQILLLARRRLAKQNKINPQKLTAAAAQPRRGQSEPVASVQTIECLWSRWSRSHIFLEVAVEESKIRFDDRHFAPHRASSRTKAVHRRGAS